MNNILLFLDKETKNLVSADLYKNEFIIQSRESSHMKIKDGQKVLNFTGHDYLGFSKHAVYVSSMVESANSFGMGASSPRIISGTQEVHKELEKTISRFLGADDTVVFDSFYSANTGLFEAILSDEDAVFLDNQCHPCVVDGVRLTNSVVFTFKNNSMEDLEDKLKRSQKARFRLIATSGVFGHEGSLADLKGIIDLAAKYEAFVCVEDSLGVGVMGERGRGTHEHFEALDQIDILTGTFTNALGGGGGGYVATRFEIAKWLRQKSRTYVFSNSLSPVLAGAQVEIIKILEEDQTALNRLRHNCTLFRDKIHGSSFQLLPGDHPNICIHVGDALRVQKIINHLYSDGIFLVGLCYPVVPRSSARIQVQMSASHTKEDVTTLANALYEAGQKV